MVAIVVALMFVGLVLTDLVLQKAYARRQGAPIPQAARARKALLERRARPGSFPWEIPQGVYLSEGHAWFRPDPSGEVSAGADALLAHALGTLDHVTLPKVGETVRRGEPLFYLVHEGRALTVSASVTGKVLATNDRLRAEPELVAQEPYGDGWVCKVVPAYLDDGSGRMRFGEKAAFWLECEFDRFCEFIGAHIPADLALGATSLDGGLPAVGSLTQMSDEAWNAFEASFLSTK